MSSYTVIDLTTLSTTAGYVVQGGTAGGRAGTWVSNAGDVNGDGIADFLIGAPGTGSGAAGAGRVHVVFGTAGAARTSIDLAALSPGDGFTIIGQPNDSGGGELGSGTGISVSNAGDVNGDGIADLIIGADRAATVNGNTGAAYVIYGRAGGTRADISLGALSPSDGFAIVNAVGTGGLDGSGSARLGFSVSGAGDVNSDGLADVIVGAPMAIGNSGDGENPGGQAFVIFGRAGATRATINVDALAATDGFSISGSQSNPFAGVSVSGAGDFNNDGFADVIVGASRMDVATSAGTAAYVIFGQAGASRSNVALDNPASYAGARVQVNVGETTNNGSSSNRIAVSVQDGGLTDGLLTYLGPPANDGSVLPNWIVATRVSSAGDVNGDGFADLVIGLPENVPNFTAATGARPTGSFIVYGRAGADPADFSAIGSTNGSNQLFAGEQHPAQLGYSVSNAGDINADGIDDLIVGRPGTIGITGNGGFTYVVFGRAGGIGDLALPDTLFTGPLTSDRGLTLVVNGIRVGDRAATSVSAAGDVNGDGIADLIVGAPLSDDGGTNAGRSYVVYGNVDFGAIVGTDGGETLTGTAGVDIINAKGGNDILDGGAGGDLLRGGAGDDRYIVDDAGDRVAELVDEGTDSVEASIAYTLPANVENLIYTGTGAATLTGNAGNNMLDTGTGATGAVTLNGGEGDDTLIIRAGSFGVSIIGGAGNDTLVIERALAIIPDDIENIVYTGTAAGTLVGNGGNNSITGGTGDDLIHSGAGTDSLSGAGGNDGFYFGASFDGSDSVDGGTGTRDQIGLQGAYAAPVTLGATSAVGIEQFVLLAGNDTRFGLLTNPTASYDIITGNAAIAASQRLIFQANTLRAGENFTLDASGELDGSVFTYGGLGSETLKGSQTADSFFFGTGRFNASDVIDGQGGVDQLGLQGTYSGANAVTFGAGQLLNVEMIVCLSNNDSRFGGAGSGTPYSYTLTMNNGNVAAGATLTVSANRLVSDEVLTFDGSAELDGHYTIFSGNGADSIIGGALADTISGRGGADNLTGGGGSDVFLYTNLTDSISAVQDHILDFTSGDVIDLSRLDAITGGANNAFAFIGDAAFGNIAGQLRAVNTSGNDWLVEADVNGDGTADLSILVATSDADPLTAGDFVL